GCGNRRSRARHTARGPESLRHCAGFAPLPAAWRRTAGWTSRPAASAPHRPGSCRHRRQWQWPWSCLRLLAAPAAHEQLLRFLDPRALAAQCNPEVGGEHDMTKRHQGTANGTGNQVGDGDLHACLERRGRIDEQQALNPATNGERPEIEEEADEGEPEMR